MSRYTRKMLDSDIESINESLVGTGSYVLAQGRNGYTGLDEYKGDYKNRDSGCCIRNLACGTPKKCLEVAVSFMEDKLNEA